MTEQITLRKVYIPWLVDATHAVWKRARYLVRGKLLKPDTWTLHNSIYSVVSTNIVGEVGSDAPHAELWEIKGVRGPIKAAPGKKIIIRKRGSRSNRSRFGVILRSATYTKVTYKPPVRFLRTALMDEMTGPKGQKKLKDLGLGVGYAVLIRYVQRITGVKSVWFNASSGGAGAQALRISGKYGMGLNVTAPRSSPMIDRYITGRGGTLR